MWREDHVSTKTENRVMLPQAKGHQRLSVSTQQPAESLQEVLLTASEGTKCAEPWSQTSDLQTSGEYISVV